MNSCFLFRFFFFSFIQKSLWIFQNGNKKKMFPFSIMDMPDVFFEIGRWSVHRIVFLDNDGRPSVIERTSLRWYTSCMHTE